MDGQHGYVLEMQGIHKTFGKVHALKGVDFALKAGEIHALIGENGAGKSTLMNILGGVIPTDRGAILRDEQPVEIQTPHDSRNLGISFIHQELNLVDDLTVYENIFLGEELTTPWGFVDVDRMCAVTAALVAQMDVTIAPQTPVRELDASFKQVVEISRALRQESRIIIMDEPTTSLTDHEIANLFQVMRSLRAAGVSIIFISHKLKEVLTICDSYTVLRDGEITGNGLVDGVSEEALARLMVGREVANREYYKQHELGKTLLEVENLGAGRFFQNMNFALREGEILGFTGLTGDGRTELFESIFGYRKYETGAIRVQGGMVVIHHPEKARRHGIGLAPKNRKENAIIPDMSILENMTLPSLPQFTSIGFINRSKELTASREYVRKLNIKLSHLDMPITSLSGGNQQKVVLAKWLEAESQIIILDNPTQGIDVGAKSEIYDLIVNLAREGKGVIMLSSEFSEILRVCDRVIVMFHGEKVAELDRSEANEDVLMMYTTGVRRDL